MFALVALLWCVHVWDGFVRLPRGCWTLRAGALKPVRGFAGPDLQLVGERLELAWTPALPWLRAYCVSGSDLRLHVSRRRLEAIDLHTRWLNVAAGVLFAWVMGVFALLVLTDRLSSLFLVWVVPAILVWITTFALFVIAYRRVHGVRPPVEVWLTVALSPISLMRAPAVVRFFAARDLHPVAAAAVLCDDAEFVRIARLFYFDFADLRLKIENIARTRDLGDRLRAAPAEHEPGVSHFCPRCHSTYRAAATRCEDCEGVPLQPLRVSRSQA
jgi:hypothetical protein